MAYYLSENLRSKDELKTGARTQYVSAGLNRGERECFMPQRKVRAGHFIAGPEFRPDGYGGYSRWTALVVTDNKGKVVAVIS